MIREKNITNKIALLATGDEIQNGDILNTNSQEIARLLFDQGIPLGSHMVAGDNITEIEKAIQFLLHSHQALIITGGLGPTSDDLTRYALAKAVNKELIFDENTWNQIVNRLKNIGYETPPESNRQQALFPKGYSIIPNAHGTAAGCLIKHGEKVIFMLPGPPAECLPMIDTHVLPSLKQQGFEKTFYARKWLLFGVSEGHIAEKLEALVKPYQCVTGYRLWYPYIEFKIYAEKKEQMDILIPLIDEAISAHVIDGGKWISSDLLKQWLISRKQTITVCDRATGGLLESILQTPETHSFLHFTCTAPTASFTIEISGLDEFWNTIPSTKTLLQYTFIHKGVKEEHKKEIPLRSSRVKLYAVEYLCGKIYQFLKSLEDAKV